MITRTPLAYVHDGTPLEGILVVDAATEAPRPGVLLVHEFMGIGEYVLVHADRLAAEGYAVLACDMYGKGVRPRDAAEASRYSRIYRQDRMLMRQRARAGLQALAQSPCADPNRLLALGFSFGGCAVLELARSGAPLLGSASFYGYLNTPHPCAKGKVQGSILVMHGVRDKVVPMEEIPVLAEEMRTAGVDCRIQLHTDAGHGFSNETLAEDPATGSAYCPKTAMRAWKALLCFYSELLTNNTE
ncbi:dienelactone hydrolase family protein [Salidesulfovibrio onnuriiensis]|uniref:dienelactone hydrolase family protein n=1 Tax=Salidesulfovibrio onnuriiensis TaxID=2583823 RepID=UPI0011C9EBC5|nr:dienelactone hydrolase family protein [Salidesulfovibrio onnuriiensis]